MKTHLLLVKVILVLTLNSAALSSETNNSTKKSSNTSDLAIRNAPIIDLSPELKQSLTRQREQIKKIQEQEDSFDESLGEAYLTYANLLLQAGRTVEAQDMFAHSLHIAKINKGVYAIEQRPILNAMFNAYEKINDIKGMENAFKQIKWVENKNPAIQDDFSYDINLRLAAAFTDLYFDNPKYNELSQKRVKKAYKYYSNAVNGYKQLKLSERKLPYREVAMLSYINTKISLELGQLASDRLKTLSRFDSRSAPIREPLRSPSFNFFGQGSDYLLSYLSKAKAENNTEQEVYALRDLGDFHLLFERRKDAFLYYKRAWEASQTLNETHEIVKSFNKPVRIPLLTVLAGKNKQTANINKAFVPVVLNINEYGRVTKVDTSISKAQYPKLIARSRRIAKSLKFRPVIEQGKMIATQGFIYHVPVKLKSGNT